jgi:hypothetical protein
LTASAFLTTGLAGRHSLAEGLERQRLAGASERGRRFLASMFDPALGLLPEFRGSRVCWLYHDNYLAAKVLDRTEPDLTRKVRETWDGTGFKDRVNRKGGHYATYKLALALIAASRLNRHPTTEEKIVERMLAVQHSDGGFVTDYNDQGRTVGMANVETTSLAVMALDGMAKP